METKSNTGFVLNDSLVGYAIHPGTILQEELRAREIKQKDFAKEIGMEASHLSALIHGVRNITPRIAAKLEKGLGISARMWLDLQNDYNLNKHKLDRSRLSSLVDGYSPRMVPAVALHEPDCQQVMTVSVTIPISDKNMLLEFAERLGWQVF